MRVAYVPEVADDLNDAREWYEKHAPGLGEDFIRMAYAAFAELGEFPAKHEVVYNRLRRILLRRFPYCVYFLVTRNLVTVYGVFHSSRDPRAIRQALADR